ncbi:MAG: dTMP kinase [Thermoplasmata archaeon]|nr:dTMP kinase [Thermoplasmata archaeon]
MAPFIVIEGIDGSGKGTQAELLRKRLEGGGVDVALTFEPTRGPIGRIIRDHMKDPFLDDRTLALLFAADRIEHIEKEVSPALSEGRTVISDRYAYSSIAYQGQTVDPDWVGVVNSDALRPDLVVVLDMGSSEVRGRIEGRGTVDCFEEDLSFLEGVRDMFLSMSGGDHLPENLMTRFLVLDATEDPEKISDVIWKSVTSISSP